MADQSTEKETINEVIHKQVSNNLSNLVLNTMEQEFILKFELFIEDSLSLASYGATLPYLNKALVYLLNKSEENAIQNPFIKIAMTLEDATFKAFILTFANLFNINNPKDDTFTIRSLFRSIGKIENGLVVIDSSMPSLIKNNFNTRQLCKNVLGFFDDKNNKNIIESYVNLRNHEVGHSTVKSVDYS